MHHLDEMKLALSPAVVERLLAQRQISVCDFRCLNTQTKQYVRRIFLANARVHFVWKSVEMGPATKSLTLGRGAESLK